MPPPQPRDPRDNPRNTAPAGNGSIAIRVQPADADVMIDGEKWRGPGNGQEPLVVELAEGPHTIQVSKSGYRFCVRPRAFY